MLFKPQNPFSLSLSLSILSLFLGATKKVR
jgi:hypothetical protein